MEENPHRHLVNQPVQGGGIGPLVFCRDDVLDAANSLAHCGGAHLVDDVAIAPRRSEVTHQIQCMYPKNWNTWLASKAVEMNPRPFGEIVLLTTWYPPGKFVFPVMGIIDFRTFVILLDCSATRQGMCAGFATDEGSIDGA
jgi:hypothetical protein